MIIKKIDNVTLTINFASYNILNDNFPMQL